MANLTIAEAITFAAQHFPQAPEKLAEFLGIEVRRSPLSCDGWCVQTANRSIIRINSNVNKVRQRFTLAHELGHLIYGVPTVVGESVYGSKKRSNEEATIDNFAAELLLPTQIVLAEIQEIPVTAKALRGLARKAKVSELAVAVRVVNLATEVGLNDASVVFYENEKLKWQWSETLKLTGDTPGELLAECTNSAPNPARISQAQNKVVVASFIENPMFNTKTVFLQLVDESVGFKQLREERIRELETYLFENDTKFRQSLNGRIGAFKTTAQAMLLDDAIQLFNRKLLQSPESLNLERLMSINGREYIRLKLQQWTKS